MPASRLLGKGVRVSVYDVAGQDSQVTAEFVRHVGLVREARDCLGPTDTIRLIHMGPPLERGEEPQQVSSVGSVALTVDEIRQIDVFIDELALEYAAARLRSHAQYVICPHVRDIRAGDGTTISRQFNCAGFVIEAYREAGIDLLVTDPEWLPGVPLADLEDQYPDVAANLRNPKLRERLGLVGDGPWPVVLSGYVLNALAREGVDIRSEAFLATLGDSFFPSRAGDGPA